MPIAVSLLNSSWDCQRQGSNLAALQAAGNVRTQIFSPLLRRFQQQSAFLPEIRRYSADAKHHWVKAAPNASGIMMRAGIKDNNGLCQ